MVTGHIDAWGRTDPTDEPGGGHSLSIRLAGLAGLVVRQRKYRRRTGSILREQAVRDATSGQGLFE